MEGRDTAEPVSAPPHPPEAFLRSRRATGGCCWWLVAGGSTTALAVARERGAGSIWTITGDHRSVRRPTPAATDLTGELGTGAPTVAGSPALGFFTVIPGNRTDIVRTIAGDSRRARTIARFHSPGISPIETPPPGVVLGRSFFFVGPSRKGSALHRVTLARSPGA